MEQGQGQVWGFVRKVHDGDTLTLQVTSRSRRNRYQYSDEEKVRLQGVDAPELHEAGGRAAKAKLAALLGQRVKCTVYSRDKYGRLICDVVPAPSDYAS